MRPAYINVQAILILLLMTWCIDAKLARRPPDLTRTMMKLLNACFTERLNPVVTTPDLHDYFREASWHIGIPPMILIDKNFEADNTQQHFPRFATFVFAPNSVKSFKAMLLKAKASPWWHKDAFFFIIGNLEGGCKPASKILKHAWKMNLLSSVFLCHEKGQSPMLYTYNPYGNRAPHPWKEIRSYNISNQWTLYAMQYHEGGKNCASLMFNKKREPVYNNERKKNSPTISENILQDLLSVANIPATFNGDYSDYSDNEEEKGFPSKLISKLYDMSVMIRNIFLELIAIISLELSFAGALVRDTNIRILSLISCGFIIVVCQKLKVASITNDSPIVSSTGDSPHRSNTAVVKFFSYSLVQLIFIIGIVYYGNLLSFFTKLDYLYANDSSGMKTTQWDHYDRTFYEKSLYKKTPRMQFINSPHSANNSKYIGDPAEKCKRILWLMMKSALKQQTMASKSNIDGILSHRCRENEPLRKKIHSLEEHFRNTGLEEYLNDSDMNFLEQTLRNMKRGRTLPLYRKIRLQDFTTAFSVLAAGIGISVFIFIVETFLRLGMSMKAYMGTAINYVKFKFARLIRLFIRQ